jgi:hypothetical protein
MTTRPRSQEFPRAFSYDRTDIHAGLTTRERRRLDAQARSLVALLAGGTAAAGGGGPRRQPVAGGEGLIDLAPQR